MNLNDSAEEGIPVAGWEGTLGLRINNRNIRINCFFQKTQQRQLGYDKTIGNKPNLIQLGKRPKKQKDKKKQTEQTDRKTKGDKDRQMKLNKYEL